MKEKHLQRGWQPILLALILSFLTAGVVFAQEPLPSDDEVNAIAKQLYCPVCENVPLDVCPTQACRQWRDVIRDKLVEGWGEDQIKNYFVQQYGDRVLAVPPPRGLNWLVYVVPPLVFIGGAFILYRVLAAWRTPDMAPTGTAPSLISSDDEYVQRLEEELKRR
jgi:cytochrome c-type biogenesis protein CcmH